MDKLTDLVRIYENSLNQNICNLLIEKFETLTNEQEKIQRQNKPNFTQVNLTKICDKSSELSYLHQFLLKVASDYREKYYNIFGKWKFPQQHGFEEFRIKRYLNNDKEVFERHIDVNDYASARRYLSFFWYLNNVDDGGETKFDNLTIKPETGKLVVFPPMWMFPHSGERPVSNTKYIISTYLHYI
jgi:prolyl 4-hydroxylase